MICESEDAPGIPNESDAGLKFKGQVPTHLTLALGLGNFPQSPDPANSYTESLT